MAELGALANLAAVVGAGLKLSILLFDLASSLHSAGSEMQTLGTEISLFCSVLKQVQSVLLKAKSFRSSVSANRATQDILDRCQVIFKELETVVNGVRSKGGDAVELIARVKWTFKKSKVQMLRASLESSKLTLHLMLTTLEFAQKIADRKTSSEETSKEDEQERALTHTLWLAQQCANDSLAQLEVEEIRESFAMIEAVESSSTIQDALVQSVNFSLPSSRRPAAAAPTDHLSRTLPDVPEGIPNSHDKLDLIRDKRTSLLLNGIVFDSSSLPEARRSTIRQYLNGRLSFLETDHLLKKWTDQDDPLASLEEVASSALSSDGESQVTASESDPSYMEVRALYDWVGEDPAELSFSKGDIIQVLTQLESGWWDGVLHETRGWFPSNYCRVWKVSETVSLAAKSRPKHPSSLHAQNAEADDLVDDEGDDEGDPEMEFWIPQVTEDGKIFYFNTLTGIKADNLPGSVSESYF